MQSTAHRGQSPNHNNESSHSTIHNKRRLLFQVLALYFILEEMDLEKHVLGKFDNNIQNRKITSSSVPILYNNGSLGCIKISEML